MKQLAVMVGYKVPHVCYPLLFSILLVAKISTFVFYMGMTNYKIISVPSPLHTPKQQHIMTEINDTQTKRNGSTAPFQSHIHNNRSVLSHPLFLSNAETRCFWPPMDQLLKQVLDFPYGIFIEVGGFDGLFQSNTYIYEKNFGWSGLLVEPAYKNARHLKSNRPYSIGVHAALTSFEKNGSYMSDPGGSPGAASIHSKNGKVTGWALSHLLDKFSIRHIDFFSLDVEGYEMTVLKGLDLTRHRPSLILIEIRRNQFNEIDKFMSRNNYVRIPGYDVENGVSGFPRGHKHRDYVYRERTSRLDLVNFHFKPLEECEWFRRS